jgi:hypothetical protein
MIPGLIYCSGIENVWLDTVATLVPALSTLAESTRCAAAD